MPSPSSPELLTVMEVQDRHGGAVVTSTICLTSCMLLHCRAGSTHGGRQSYSCTQSLRGIFVDLAAIMFAAGAPLSIVAQQLRPHSLLADLLQLHTVQPPGMGIHTMR